MDGNKLYFAEYLLVKRLTLRFTETSVFVCSPFFGSFEFSCVDEFCFTGPLVSGFNHSRAIASHHLGGQGFRILDRSGFDCLRHDRIL
jgi:hypothetical protein